MKIYSLAETPDGEWLDGGKNYKLVIPPTDPERRFFLLARFYGPEPEIVNGSF